VTPEQKLRCEAQLRRGPGRCHRKATTRANGLDVCAQHAKAINRTFALADQRWRDAGEPESDL
jgi:hypothetical protein